MASDLRKTGEETRGTYALLLRCARTREVTVGALGRLRFEAGWYVYVGSALGPGGLAARVGRHRKAVKKPRWHVDYLRRVCALEEVVERRGAERLECVWAGRLEGLRAVEGFGSSDCGCTAHLFYSAERPDLRGLE